MGWTVAGNIKGPPGDEGPVGPEGPQGVPGPVGPAGLTWRGAWSNANAYAVDDSVSWGGSSYHATAPHAAGANQPPTGTTADPGGDDVAVNAGWAVLSIQGTEGPAGAAGATGAQGIQGIQGPQGLQGVAGSSGAAGATGAQGPQGDPGPTGSAGATGQRGTNLYTGTGAPGTIAGSLPNDKYLDLSTGDVYTLS